MLSPTDRRPLQPFVPAGRGASRSPCPALNALANHSYIPHDGRSIPFGGLVDALRVIYHLSLPLALLLSLAGFLWCGHLVGSGLATRLALDLHDLARHNRIEHDGSLGHADAAPGAPYAPSSPDKARIANMLAAGSAVAAAPSSASGFTPEKTTAVDALSILDFARVRYSLDLALRAPLDAVHAEIARGEVALTLLVLGTRGAGGDDAHDAPVVPKARIREWYGEERLPLGWTPPEREVTLWRTTAMGRKVKKDVARLSAYSQFH